MFSRIRQLFRYKSKNLPHKRSNQDRRCRLEVESLENRLVPTVTYWGGAVMPHVEVQALYDGADWANNSALVSQKNYLDGFLGNIVNSSYMDMLSNAGYGVGRGSASPGFVLPAPINKAQPVDDSNLRALLQASINLGQLQAPDPNRLYVIFVEPGVTITAFGTDSTQFSGYHDAFAGRDRFGNPAAIRYAVIAYNSPYPAAPSLTMTVAASHEIAEAVTDPDELFTVPGWFDGTTGEEIGDKVSYSTVYLNGYAVQRIADPNGQAMTPRGATAQVHEAFTLSSYGGLSGYGFNALDPFAQISDQGIDFYGAPMVDLVTRGGHLWEYHAGSIEFPNAWPQEVGNGFVKSAKAGQAVSYVLSTDGILSEWSDTTRSFNVIAYNIASIDAGTDKVGVNCVYFIDNSGNAWQFSDTSGKKYLAGGPGFPAKAVSGGQQGMATLLMANNYAYIYNDATGTFNRLASGVQQATVGFDQYGNTVFDVLYTSGVAAEYRPYLSQPWIAIASNVQSIDKARNGYVDIVTTSGVGIEFFGMDMTSSSYGLLAGYYPWLGSTFEMWAGAWGLGSGVVAVA
jgi:hypothetical protein